MIHWLSHRLGLNFGRVVTFKLDGVGFISFQCSTCGEINSAQKSVVQW